MATPGILDIAVARLSQQVFFFLAALHNLHCTGIKPASEYNRVGARNDDLSAVHQREGGAPAKTGSAECLGRFASRLSLGRGFSLPCFFLISGDELSGDVLRDSGLFGECRVMGRGFHKPMLLGGF